TVAFAVQNYRAKTIRADLVFCFQYLAAIQLDSRQSQIKPAITVQINQRTVGRRARIVHFTKAATDAFLRARQQAEAHAGVRLLLELDAEDRAVKSNSAFQITHRDVTPNNLVSHKRPFSPVTFSHHEIQRAKDGNSVTHHVAGQQM